MNLGQNKGSLIGGGLLVLLMLACGFFLWKFRGANKALEAENSSLVEQIANVGQGKDPRGNKKPSPTRENVRAIDENISDLTRWYSNYVDRLFADLPPQEAIDPADFQLKATKVADDIAAFAKKQDVKLGVDDPNKDPRGLGNAFPGAFQQPGVPGVAGQPLGEEEDEVIFNMDFDRFLAEGERPDEEDIPRLTRQLGIIDDMLRLLVDHGVERIVSVERDKFDAVEDDPNNFNRGLIPGMIPGLPGEEIEEDEILFENEVFKFSFEGKEGNVFQALNAINQLPYPASVMQLNMSNMNPDLIPFQSSDKNASPGAGVPPPQAPAMASPDGASDAISLILASGDESVHVDIEVYVAKPPEPVPEEF